MSEERARSRGGTYPVRRGSPPPRSYFDAPRAAPGNRCVRLSLDEVRIELRGLDDPRAGELLRRFKPYTELDPPEAEGVLRVEVGLEERDYFVTPPARPEFNPLFLEADGDGVVRYAGYRVAGWLDPRGGRALLLLARGDYEPDLRAFENYLRVAVAWRAATLGGALVHAASAVRRGRGYLFYGESGAGKSTLAASTRRATVVSDDLSLVLPDRTGALHLIGSPFRGTFEEGDPVRGRFPLAAGFRLLQADEAEVVRVPRVLALAEIVGNLPFVAESFATRPDLFEAIERAFSSVPLAHLRFRKDDSYWDAIDRAGL